MHLHWARTLLIRRPVIALHTIPAHTDSYDDLASVALPLLWGVRDW